MATTGSAASAEARAFRFRPPELAQTVARERLFECIDRRRLLQGVWITAPAGYGKTTLAGDYFRHRPARPAWYHLDPEDADPALFVQRLSMALEPILRGAKLPALALEHLTNLDAFARYYFGELAQRLPVDALIVLDNYHQLAEDSPVHKLLAHGIGRLAAGSWLVASRRPPPAALTGLLGRRVLALISTQDLRLTLSETEQLIAGLDGKGTSDIDAAALYERADGWPAGVVLLLHQRRLAPHASSDDSLAFAYVAGQILGELTEELRRFLLTTAWLPEVTISDAASLNACTEAEAAVILDRLVTQHALIARIPGETLAYRYHPLLIDVLRHETEALLGVDVVQDQKRQSARLLADRNPDVAIHYLLDTNAHEDVLDLIARHAETDLASGQVQRVAGWLSLLPPDLAARSPWVHYWKGRCELPYRPREAKTHLQTALATFEDSTDAWGCYLAWAALLEIHGLEWGTRTELDRLVAELQRLQSIFPVPDDPLLQALLLSGRYTALLWSMREGDDFSEFDRDALQLIESAELPPPVRGNLALTFLIRHVWHLGSAALAGRVVEQVTGLLDRLPLAVQASLQVLIEGYRLWFDFEPPPEDARMESVLHSITETRLDVLLPLVHSQRAYTLLCLGRTGEAREALELMVRHTPPHRVQEWTHGHLIASWERLQADDAEGACELLTNVAIPYYGQHAPGDAICHVLYAITLHRLGVRREALRELAHGRRICRRIGSADLEFVARLYLAQMAARTGAERRVVGLLASAFRHGRSRGFARAPFVSPADLAELCGLALEHDVEREYTLRLIAANRLAPPATCGNEHWPWPLHVRALGPLELHRLGDRLTLATGAQEKPLALLRLLIAAGDTELPLDAAASALWPDAEGDRALASLKTTLHRLRGLVGTDAVVQRRNRLRLSPERVWVDVGAFERLLHNFEQSGDPRALERAIDLYRGPLLADAGADPDLERARVRLRGRFALAVESLCAVLLAAGKPLEALARCRSAIAIEPMSVALQHRYQGLCLELGRPADAVEAYRHYAAVLTRAELGAPPKALTEPLSDWL